MDINLQYKHLSHIRTWSVGSPACPTPPTATTIFQNGGPACGLSQVGQKIGKHYNADLE